MPNPKGQIKGVRVTFNDGNTKDYPATGYDLKNYNFKSGKELALYIFKGKGVKATKLKKKNIRTWETY